MLRKAILCMLITLIANSAVANALLEWSNAGMTQYNGGTITSCGPAKGVDFIATYAYGQSVSSTGTPSPNCPGGFGANPYRITLELYRDNTLISTYTVQTSSCWARRLFQNVAATPGNYSVNYKFERRQLVGGWGTLQSGSTSITPATKAPAVPNLSINGQGAPASGAINVSITSGITLDGSSTQCATFYWVGVHESDLFWNRTYKYEWGKWFTGAPPNNLNLQQLATTYSQPPDWAGNNVAQQRTPLIAGFLDPPANTQARYYRVALCTNEPSWVCKITLLRVNY